MITNDTVKYIASLSRLHIEEERISAFGAELQNILQYVEKLNRLDISGVPATSHVIPVENVFRDDIAVPSLTQDEALSFSIDHYAGHYKVPRVIE